MSSSKSSYVYIIYNFLEHTTPVIRVTTSASEEIPNKNPNLQLINFHQRKLIDFDFLPNIFVFGHEYAVSIKDILHTNKS